MEQKLLAVGVNQNGYEYDIHSLVKAFYPECTVKVFLMEEEGREEHYSSSENYPDLQITFTEEAILGTCVSTGDQEKRAFNGKKILLAEDMDKPRIRNCLKQLLYTILSELTGRELPWGTLTGIRPVKIPMALMKEGGTEEEILQYMKDVYLISEEKGRLAIEIAGRENQLLSSIHYRNGYSLYIGIPFCPTTCLYCSFTSFPIQAYKKRVGDYLAALEKELDFTAQLCRDKFLDSIYIGGGTPTTLEAEELDRLLEKICRTFDLGTVKEFTVEAGRPDSITREKLAVMKKWGITRISVNPQTMKQETLEKIGRRHTTEQVREAYALVKEAGFDNVNMDLILGLPDEGEEDVAMTLREIRKLDPESLTVHSLAVKRASALNRWIEENGLSALANTESTMEIAQKGAREMGMVPYYLYRQKNMSGNFENVGYAKEGKFGIYNILIMEEVQDIIACGAGGISKRVYPDGRIERCENVKEVEQYIERIDEMLERKNRLFASETNPCESSIRKEK